MSLGALTAAPAAQNVNIYNFYLCSVFIFKVNMNHLLDFGCTLTILSHVILKDQPNLRTRLDDAFLLRFLRARKFDYDRALQLLLNYHAGRKAWPEVFQDLKPSTVKHVLDLGFLTVLPHPDPNGRYILCLRPGLCHFSSQIVCDICNKCIATDLKLRKKMYHILIFSTCLTYSTLIVTVFRKYQKSESLQPNNKQIHLYTVMYTIITF